jgi:serine/threonine protein kinase
MQVASALVYVQKQGIIHRDVALRSVLASKSGNKVVAKVSRKKILYIHLPQLANFGLSVVAAPDGTYTAKKNRCMLKW